MPYSVCRRTFNKIVIISNRMRGRDVSSPERWGAASALGKSRKALPGRAHGKFSGLQSLENNSIWGKNPHPGRTCPERFRPDAARSINGRPKSGASAPFEGGTGSVDITPERAERRLGRTPREFMADYIYPHERRYYQEAERLGPWAVFPVVEELKPLAREGRAVEPVPARERSGRTDQSRICAAM